MKTLTKTFRRICAGAVVAGLFAAAAQGQEEASSSDTFNIPADVSVLGPSDPNNRRASAKVNGALITGTMVDERVNLIVSANEVKPSPEELQRLRLQVFRNLIDETLQIQEAAAQEMAVTPEEVNETYARVAAEQFNTTPEAFDARLRAARSSPESLKRQIEGELAWDRLLRRNVAPFVSVSAGEVNELYERMQQARGSAEYRLGEIYLSATPTTRAAVEQNARRIVEQLRGGASFVAYARQYSEASTAAVGGDLGWIRLEQLQNPQLETVARELNPGQLVGPIEIPGGFSILYLIDKRQIGVADPRDATVSLKQISLELPDTLSEAEFNQRTAAFVEGVRQIRGCGEADAGAAAIGAQVVSNDMVVKDLPEVLQQWVLELNVGQTTRPYGDRTSVRLLMLCGRDDPQVESGPDREALLSQMEDDRINKRAQRYLRDLRRDAVIEYN